MFENPRRSRQGRNFTTNVPKIVVLKSSSEQIFFRKLSLGAPDCRRYKLEVKRRTTGKSRVLKWSVDRSCTAHNKVRTFRNGFLSAYYVFKKWQNTELKASVLNISGVDWIFFSVWLGRKKSGAPNVTFQKISVRKTIWDLQFSEQLL